LKLEQFKKSNLLIWQSIKGRAALEVESSLTCAALKWASTMCVTMKNTCDMLFTQAVNAMYEAENDAKGKRAPALQRSMQQANDFLVYHGLAGIQPHQITYHWDKKIFKLPILAIAMSLQMHGG